MKNVTIIDHPLVGHNLARLRDVNTGSQEFRRILGEVSALMVYEATRSFEVRSIKVLSPLATAAGSELVRRVVLVPVLRAGLGMLDGILNLMPQAIVGMIGLKREESTLRACFYHQSLPGDLSESEVLLIDPMLATGGSAVAALDLLEKRKAARVRMVNLVAAPEGINAVHERYPQVPIFTAAIDERLNDHGYIVPGLGDAGDRLFGV